jgi:diguanylate cyclase (GGDEF)-like protein
MTDNAGAGSSSSSGTAGSLAARLRQSFRVVLAGVAATAAITGVVFAYVLLKARPDVERLVDGGNAAALAHNAMVDQETGVRGYLLGRADIYLAPYRAGRTVQTTQEGRLTALVGGEPGMSPRLLARRLAEQAWQDQWVMPALSGAIGAPGTPELDAFLSGGKTLFDAYRTRHAAVISAIDAHRETAIRNEDLALGGGAAVDMVVLLGTAFVARRESRRLQEAVVAPVADLVGTMRRVQDGDLRARPALSGPDELRQIGVGLAEMTHALAEAQSSAVAREKEVADQAQSLDQVLTMSREIAGSLNLTYVLQAVGTSTVSLGGFRRVAVWLLDEDAGRLDVAYDSTVADRQASTELGRDLIGQTAKYGRTMMRGTDNVFRTGATQGIPVAEVAVPMVVGARVIGLLECVLEEPAELPPRTLDVLETLASQAATAIEAARLHEHTEELSQTDALTRLLNRRRLDADIEAEVYRATRYARPLAFIMIDVDNFKRFNDRYGHQRGDEALEVVAKVLAEGVRESDTAYRFGGEELAVLCRETDLDGGTLLAERLRAGIERRLEPEGVTASFGVAAVPMHGTSAAELVKAADEALYVAKGNGRNRVSTATAP